MCVQGHPEFSDDMVSDMLELKRSGGLDRGTAEEAFANLRENSVDPQTFQAWSTLLKTFLKED